MDDRSGTDRPSCGNARLNGEGHCNTHTMVGVYNESVSGADHTDRVESLQKPMDIDVIDDGKRCGVTPSFLYR